MQVEKKDFLIYPPTPMALRLQVLLVLTFFLKHTWLASVSCSPSFFVYKNHVYNYFPITLVFAF